MHLESMQQNAEIRKQQLEVILPALRKQDGESQINAAILCGDMNMDAASEENLTITQHTDYCDLWPALHPDDPGFTEDYNVNLVKKNLLEKEGKTFDLERYKPVRFDRVLLSQRLVHPKDVVEPAEMTILGTTPVSNLPGDSVQLWPSDHLGLAVSLKIVDNSKFV